MKKIIPILAIVGLLFGGFALAKVDRVDAGLGPWNLTGTYTIDFKLNGTDSYIHTMNVTSMNLTTGDFSGAGFYNADHSYTWNVTGNVTGSNLTFTIVYTGTNAGYTVNATGVIAADGTMSGAATGPGQSFTWQTTTGAATHEMIIYKNHGQYVKSQENKQEAAQSRIGMPEQSKGHAE
jgi:hypothetical protein